MNPNDLLLWMSAMGSGTWSRYRAAVDEIQASDNGEEDDEDLAEGASTDSVLPIAHRLRMNLECLGHAEFFRLGFPNGWRVVPPTLVSISTDAGCIGILCGARTEQVIMRIEHCAENLRLETEQQLECPDRVQVRADEQFQLKRLADLALIRFQPEASRMLLAAMPPVDDSQLRTPFELPFGNEWDVKRFSVETLAWTSVPPDEARKATRGLFRFTVQFQRHYFLRLRDVTYRVPVQVGKYILLRNERRRVVSYDPDKRQFVTPVSCRPPLLVDRALTLCSGLVPRLANGVLSYGNVSRAIATAASQLLRQ